MVTTAILAIQTMGELQLGAPSSAKGKEARGRQRGRAAPPVLRSTAEGWPALCRLQRWARPLGAEEDRYFLKMSLNIFSACFLACRTASAWMSP